MIADNEQIGTIVRTQLGKNYTVDEHRRLVSIIAEKLLTSELDILIFKTDFF